MRRRYACGTRAREIFKKMRRCEARNDSVGGGRDQVLNSSNKKIGEER